MANESGLSELLQDGGKDGRIEISGMAWQHESNCRGEFVEFLFELYVIRVAEVVKRGNAAVLVEVRHDRHQSSELLRIEQVREIAIFNR